MRFPFYCLIGVAAIVAEFELCLLLQIQAESLNSIGVERVFFDLLVLP